MVRLHGSSPYETVLIHGGPGAAGSLRVCAEELSGRLETGIVEAFQSRYSIEALIEELYEQVREHCREKAVLIGHSWGAWLAALFAQAHPEASRDLILVGCPPLKDQYVEKISERRLCNLLKEEQEVFQRLKTNQMTEEDMRKIPVILEKSDNYCLTDRGLGKEETGDSQMYNRIWEEAADLRTSGKLLAAFREIQCRICLIQGLADPHPAEGVTEPLKELGISCEIHMLARCGHNPFWEKYAKEPFYRLLCEKIAGTDNKGA